MWYKAPYTFQQIQSSGTCEYCIAANVCLLPSKTTLIESTLEVLTRLTLDDALSSVSDWDAYIRRDMRRLHSNPTGLGHDDEEADDAYCVCLDKMVSTKLVPCNPVC